MTSASMDDTPQSHRRRRSSIMGFKSPDSRNARREKGMVRKHRRRTGDRGEDWKLAGSQDMESEFSSCSTSDDVELGEVLSEDGLEDDEEMGLRKGDRRRRRMRKKRDSRLDVRVGGDVKMASIQQSLADRAVWRKSLINGLLIGLWYLFSLSISIYNKWMFSKDHLDFHFPLFTTCAHMLVQFTLASTVLYFIPRFRPRHDFDSHREIDSPAETGKATDSQKPLMTKQFYVTRIGPCGAATGLDIGLGNMSLKFISLTFYTMCKSSSLVFVLLFAFLFRLESPSIKLALIILTMTVGVVMMVAGETAFNALGFILIISAAFFSGFRWALTQILLLRNPATSNPFSSIFYLAPIMFVSLLVLAVPVEGIFELAASLRELVAVKGVLLGTGILLFPGMLAFLMTASEFALLQRTSVVTLSICGIFKEVVTICAAGIVFHDTLTPINISGLLVTIGSIAGYNYIKIKKMRTEARREVELGGSSGKAAAAATRSSREYAPLSGNGLEDDLEEEDQDSSSPPTTTYGVFGRADGSYRPSRAHTPVASTRNSITISKKRPLPLQTQFQSPSSSSPSLHRSPTAMAGAADHPSSSTSSPSPKNNSSSPLVKKA